jgi:hypothetical protein
MTPATRAVLLAAAIVALAALTATVVRRLPAI